MITFRIPPAVLHTDKTTNVTQIGEVWYYWVEEFVVIDGNAQTAFRDFQKAMKLFADAPQINTSDDHIMVSGYIPVPDHKLEKLKHFLANKATYEAELKVAAHEVAVLLEKFPELDGDQKYLVVNARYSVAELTSLANGLKGKYKE